MSSQFVWGPFYVNQLVQETNSSGTFYVHQNANWDVTSITDASTGDVVERYSYDPDGNVTVMDGE
jgi:YD repeat-containing protein